MDLKLPKACLFDLDDTILSDNSVSEDCWRLACQEWVSSTAAGVDTESLLRSILGARDWFFSDPVKYRWLSLNLPGSRAQVVLRAFESIGIDDPASAEPLALRFDAIKKGSIGPFPGAIETLHYLRRNGHKLALITNGKETLQREKIDRFELEPLFECIVIEGAFGVGKPDKRVFTHALDELKVSPAEAWMIGDNLVNDIAGAQAVGLYAIWVDWVHAGLPADSAAAPDRVIHSIEELTAGN